MESDATAPLASCSERSMCRKLARIWSSVVRYATGCIYVRAHPFMRATSTHRVRRSRELIPWTQVIATGGLGSNLRTASTEPRSGLPAERRRRLPKVYRSTDDGRRTTDDVEITAQFPWRKSLQRRLSP